MWTMLQVLGSVCLLLLGISILGAAAYAFIKATEEHEDD